MDCRSTNTSHRCEKNQTFSHHRGKSPAKQYVGSESLQGSECGGSCVFYFRNKIIFSGPQPRRSEDVSRRNYAKSIENDAMFKTSAFNRRTGPIGSDYSTSPTREAMVPLVILASKSARLITRMKKRGGRGGKCVCSRSVINNKA